MQPKYGVGGGAHSAMSNVEFAEKRMHITFESKVCSVLQMKSKFLGSIYEWDQAARSYTTSTPRAIGHFLSLSREVKLQYPACQVRGTSGTNSPMTCVNIAATIAKVLFV